MLQDPFVSSHSLVLMATSLSPVFSCRLLNMNRRALRLPLLGAGTYMAYFCPPLFPRFYLPLVFTSCLSFCYVAYRTMHDMFYPSKRDANQNAPPWPSMMQAYVVVLSQRLAFHISPLRRRCYYANCLD